MPNVRMALLRVAGRLAFTSSSRLARPVIASRRGTVRGIAAIADNDKSSLKLADNFWEKIAVEQTETGARTVTMAGRPLRTPAGQSIEIPATRPPLLAELVAAEWAGMSTLTVKNHHIPLTSLVARSLDVTAEERETVTEKLLPYLDTDTLLIVAPAKDCDGTLRAAQLELYPPVVEDACTVWGVPSLKVLDTEEALFGNYQSPEVKERVLAWIRGLDNFQFASLERATTAARSLIVGMNVVLHRRSVDELATLANLDVIHQTQRWGEVEDTHDVEKVDIRRLLGAAYINAM